MNLYFKKQINVLTIIILWLSTISPVYASSVNHDNLKQTQMMKMQSMHHSSADQNQSMSTMSDSCTCVDNCSILCEACDQVCGQSNINPFLSLSDNGFSIASVIDRVCTSLTTRNVISVNTSIFRPPIN